MQGRSQRRSPDLGKRRTPNDILGRLGTERFPAGHSGDADTSVEVQMPGGTS
jgi:hypothetical protein